MARTHRHRIRRWMDLTVAMVATGVHREYLDTEGEGWLKHQSELTNLPMTMKTKSSIDESLIPVVDLTLSVYRNHGGDLCSNLT